ncbi:MAG: acyl-CoA desaturase [Myxococcales bacterium]
MTTALPRVRFPSSGAFHTDLKARVAAYFQRSGRPSHGGFRMRLKTCVLFGWLAGSYGLLMFAPVTAWQAVLLLVSVGLAMAGIGFSVMHDANHGGYSSSPRVNRILGFTSDLIGGSSHLWRHKHNIMHHTYTNISGMDADLDAGPLLRFAPWQSRHAIHRFQHLYIWVLYGVFPLRWFFVDDFVELATGRIGGQAFAPPRGWDLASMLAGKAFFVGWAFVLPLLLHPTWALIPMWLFTSFVLGNVIAVVFQLAHCAEEADFHESRAGSQLMNTEWAVHQVTTTVDFARGNGLLGWYLGGLNFQVEHHLFPRICHVHYPALSRIVEETCRAHGVRYRAEPTFRAALSANVRWLRRMGSAPASLPGRPAAAA